MTGKVNVNITHPSEVFSTFSVPFSNFAILYEMASPSPLREKFFSSWFSKLSKIEYRLKICWKSFSLMVLPSLATRSTNSPSPVVSTSILMLSPSGVYLNAFEIRLIIIVFRKPLSEFQDTCSGILLRKVMFLDFAISTKVLAIPFTMDDTFNVSMRTSLLPVSIRRNSISSWIRLFRRSALVWIICT